MLKEYSRVRQDPEGFKRLFSDETFDLYLWYNEEGNVLIGFQLVQKYHDEHDKAFTWEMNRGANYTSVYQQGKNNGAPLLMVNGSLDSKTLIHQFSSRAQYLPIEINEKILKTIEEFASPRFLD